MEACEKAKGEVKAAEIKTSPQEKNEISNLSYVEEMSLWQYFVLFGIVAAELAVMYLIQNVYKGDSPWGVVVGIVSLFASLAVFFSALTAYRRHLKRCAKKKRK